MDENLYSQEVEDGGISVIDILMRCLSNWYWFIISVVFALTFAFYYVKKQEPVYFRSATILVKEEANSASNKMGVQEDMGVFKANNSVANEIFAIRSPQVVNEVVKRLRLNMNYSIDGKLHRKTLYGWTCPIDVEFSELDDSQWADFTVNLQEEGKVDIYDINGVKEHFKGKLNEFIKTSLGNVKITPTQAYHGQELEVYVSHWTVEAASSVYQGGLAVKARDRSSVVDLSYADVCTQRAEDFLNAVIQVYSEFWVNDRNQIAESTNDFISERLAVIEKELGTVENEISNYKIENLIPDGAHGSVYTGLQNTSSLEQLDLLNQISMTKYLKEYVTDEKNLKKLIPAVPGMGNDVTSSLIQNYNEKITERNAFIANSSEINPLVTSIDEELSNLHQVILSTLDNQLMSLEKLLKTSKTTESMATQKIKETPPQAKYLLSVERQQAVKQSLYTYLLQRREENELSRAFTAYNTRILNPATGSSVPISPEANNIYLIALGIGVCLPLVIIVLLEILNTTVRGRKDVESMQTPFLGEIPFVMTEKTTFLQRLFSMRDFKKFIMNEPVIARVMMKVGLWKKQDRESDKRLNLFVRGGSRNQINEAFRVVRSNMQFIQSNSSESQIVMITSANAGSGKTFISINLAASFVVNGKKVLVIDMDFRKRSLSKYVHKPQIGLVDYLANRSATYENLIIKGSLMDNLDILPVGVIPPNPTELLQMDRLQTMLSELRKEYDIIFLDCPPVEIVADASIITKYADKTLFLVRAGLLQRSMLPEIDKFYASKKFGNMMILLNGTDDSYGKYGYSRYGYRYGYQYGYGSHYGSESYYTDNN